MYPHERSLVKQYDNRPFVILGVNSDPDREKLKTRVEEENITWRSWFAGSTNGKIPLRWNVTGWPTIYVLDHRGVIRYRGVRGERMDEAVDTLLAELESGEAAPDAAKKKQPRAKQRKRRL